MGKFKKLLTLSFKNLKSHRWLNVKLTLALTCLMFLLCIFCIFPVTLFTSLNDYKTKDIAANYIMSETEIDDKLTKSYTKTHLQEYYTMVGIEINLIIRLSDKNYKCNSTEWEFFNLYSGELFTQNDFKALKSSYGLDTLIIGEMPLLDSEILISEKLLIKCGLTPDEVLNKEITLFNSKGEQVTETVTVSGIIRKEYYELAGHGEFGVNPSVYMMKKITTGSTSTTDYYIYSFEEFPTVDEVKGWLESGASAGDYMGSSTIESIEFANHLQNIVVRLFSVLGVLICAGALFTVYLLMDKYIKYFSRSGGILSVCGADKKCVNTVIFLQLLFFCIIAALISFVFVIVIYKLLDPLFSWYLTGEVMGINLRFLLTLFGIGFGAVFIVSLAIFGFNYIVTRKKTIKEMLETSVD